MADSEKGANTTPTKPKQKSPLLDDDIGNEFLSSWKSTKDDAMDLCFEPIPKGNKKSTMNFENLDMDFNLGDDFSKLSSFKMDMSDLDFSSPARKSSKPKEISEEKSSTGNRHEKEDNFSFNFDFGLDGFDFGPTLEKGETKSSAKKLDGKEGASETSESRGSKVNPTKGFDTFDDDIAMERPVSETIATQKVKNTAADVGDFSSMKDDCPSKSATFRTSTESNVEQTSPGTTKESDQEKHLLEEEMFKEPRTEPVIEDITVQSAGENDTVPISIPQQQIGASSIGRSDDLGGLQNGHDNMDTEENLNHDNLPCKGLPLSITMSEKGDVESNKSSIGASQENMGRTVKPHDDLDLEDASKTSVSRKTVHTPPENRELQNSNSASLVPVDSEMALDTPKDNDKETQMHREPIGDIVATRKGKEEGGVCSKYFKRSEDITPQKEQAPPSEINVFSISTNRLDAKNLISSDEMRVELNAKSANTMSKLDTKLQPSHEEIKDGNSVILGSGQKFKSPSNIREVFDADGAQSGQKILANSRLHDNEVTKREPNSLGNVKSTISSRIQVEASVSNGKTPKSSDQTIMNSKLVAPRMESVRNTRIVSAEGNKLSSLKDGLKKPDSSILKSSRTTVANNDVQSATLQRQTSALRNNVKNMEALRNSVSKISQQTPQTPSLKRKSSEMSNSQDSAPLKPLKRPSESPIETRNVKEHSKDAREKLACNRQTKNNATEHLTSVPEVPQDVNMKEPEILLIMEDNGNVEKAEAYAKDLDEICNMLRKKHEEAKELLVRAVVNNNNLLMLHHPIYAEKIRMAQNFATKLMSKLTIN